MANDDDDDSLPPLGEDTDKFLADVKKGKPRNFLLVCKGAKVKYLAVRKKPIKASELAEAKKAGYKGDGYFGVVNGGGMLLVFNLAQSDGYDSEPVKEKVLKDFLEEKAKFKCKPSFAIVATPPGVPFDDEDLSHPVIARFMALSGLIEQVATKLPETQTEIAETANTIRLLLQAGDFATGEPHITTFEARLKSLLSGGAPSASATATAPATPVAPAPTPTAQTPAPAQPVETTQAQSPTTSDDNVLRGKLLEALTKLVPQLKQAVEKQPERKVELLTPVARIKQQIEQGLLSDAKAGLLEVGKLLKATLAAAAQPTTSSTGDQPAAPVVESPSDDAEFMRLFAGMEDRYLAVLRQNPDNAGKLRAVMDFANGKAELSDYKSAVAALNKLETLLTETEEQLLTAAIDSLIDDEDEQRGVVAQRKALLRWDAVRSSAMDQVRALQAIVAQTDPEASIDRLDEVFDEVDESLHDALIDCMNVEDEADRTYYNECALAAITQMRQRIDSSELIEGIDRNPFVKLNIKASLTSALDDVASMLG